MIIKKIIAFNFILLQTYFFQINCQDNEDITQQIHSKVKRINLRDYGIQRSNPRHFEAKDNQRFKDIRSNPSGHGLDHHLSSFGGRNQRHDKPIGESDQFDSSVDTRPIFMPNRDKSSPIEWSSSPRIEIRGGSDSEGRRPFDFSSFEQPLSSRIQTQKQEIPRTQKQERNCSQLCVDTKYLQHYEAKRCVPTYDYECNCSLGYRCPSTHSLKNSSVCHFEGRVYQIGSRIPVRNPCRICECRNIGRRTGERLAEIDCGIGIECPEAAFGLRPEPNCYFAYERDQCCGHQICNTTLVAKRHQKICTYNGKQYKRGQKIYPNEDNCKMCICSDDWDDTNPLSSGACHKYSCDLELDKDFKNGCLPIYHEGTCCPIEYKCPKNFAIPSIDPKPNNCIFDGRIYPIGSHLTTDNVCTECVCRAPPDFTCIHKSCPTPPHNCYVGKWNNTICCQSYICSRPDHIRDESQFKLNFYSNHTN